MRHLRFAAVVVVAAVIVAGVVPVVTAASSYRIIVHPNVKGNQIPRNSLSSIFLRQASRWGDGSAARPVDQSVRSPVRQAFSNEVLQQELVAVQLYWSRKMASGQVPPPVKTSDEEVVAFVAATPGAIGYVSSEAPLPDSVREVAIIQ